MKNIYTKSSLKEELEKFDFINFFKAEVVSGENELFNGKNIDLGKKRGEFHDIEEDHLGVFEANKYYLEKYPICNSGDESEGNNRIQSWKDVLGKCEDYDEFELFLETLDIFDWGNVYEGNVPDLIKFRRGVMEINGKYITLKDYYLGIRDYIKHCKPIEDDRTAILFSSGWTKVYSYIFDTMLIYDSRVSAYLNYCLFQGIQHFLEYNNSDETKRTEGLESFKLIMKHLSNFGGTNSSRTRKLPLSSKFFAKSDDVSQFNANVIASQIANCLWEYGVSSELKERYNLQNETNGIRVIERAFFILGFDLSQLKAYKNDIDSESSNVFDLKAMANLIS